MSRGINETRIKYQRETGIQVDIEIFFAIEEKDVDTIRKLVDYIEYLEDQK